MIEYPIDEIDKIIETMDKRIEMVLNAKGMIIKYYLTLDNCHMLMICRIDLYAKKGAMKFTSLIVFHLE